jgi:hypothetical protein
LTPVICERAGFFGAISDQVDKSSAVSFGLAVFSFFKIAAKVETKVGQTYARRDARPAAIGIFERAYMPKVRQVGMICLTFVPPTEWDGLLRDQRAKV